MNERPIGLFAECVEQLAAGVPLDVVLARHPEASEELAQMMAAVEQLRADHPSPAPDYLRESRARLVALASDRRRQVMTVPALVRRMTYGGALVALVIAAAWLSLDRPGMSGAPGFLGASVDRVAGFVWRGDRSVAATPAPTMVARLSAPRLVRPIARLERPCLIGAGCATPTPAATTESLVVFVVAPTAVPAVPVTPELTADIVLAPPPSGTPPPPQRREPTWRDAPHVGDTPASGASPTLEIVTTPTSYAPSPTAVVCAGVIAGTVRDAIGYRVAGASVTVVGTGETEAGDRDRTTVTGVDGAYRLDHLCAGSFFVSAQMNGPLTIVGAFDPDGDGQPDAVTLPAPDATALSVEITLDRTRLTDRPPTH
jgi:hypothetical protein